MANTRPAPVAIVGAKPPARSTEDKLAEQAAQENAQDILMVSLQCAMGTLRAANAPAELQRAAANQFRRVEKLFGYEEDSWPLFTTPETNINF
jgi:hypothetical protein